MAYRYDDDKEYNNAELVDVKGIRKKHNTDGSKTSFYDCKGCEDVDDLSEHWELKGDEFNCLKAIVGIAKGSRHSGTSPLRDAKKLVHYANRILKRIEND